ncbi:MAG: peptide methionine sulfoxide reductase msrA/msrB [Oceanicoccus sp.]|jgi:peptide methionine sulfoxide reductase msrA/msrB
MVVRLGFTRLANYNEVMKTPHIILIVLAILFTAWLAWGYFSVASVEQLSYTVIDDSKEYEIRQIDDHIVAEVTVTGNYKDASNEGFMKVADYIFGNNTSSDKVAMTTPVINSEDLSEKVAMTTPVINSEDLDSETQVIAFVVPSSYTIDTLPTPNNEEVTLREVEGQKVAVLKFTWWATSERMENKTQELIEYLERDGLEYTALQTARYNPPWTPPFMLHNEVWATITSKTTQEVISEIPENAELATFAGGCFWCIENSFDNQDGVYEAVSGYVGGTEKTANYTDVSNGQTKHREAIQVYYDPSLISYNQLLDLFWNQIDPTDSEGQFVDKGYQYTSAIYTHSNEQAEQANQSLETLRLSEKYEEEIATEILAFEENFFLAEEYHQDYAKKQSAAYTNYKDNSGRK